MNLDPKAKYYLGKVDRDVKQAGRGGSDQSPHGAGLNGFGPFRPTFKRVRISLVRSSPWSDPFNPRVDLFFYIFLIIF